MTHNQHCITQRYPDVVVSSQWRGWVQAPLGPAQGELIAWSRYSLGELDVQWLETETFNDTALYGITVMTARKVSCRTWKTDETDVNSIH